jgi:ubiquinone biosynthesis accessory factor UbiK
MTAVISFIHLSPHTTVNRATPSRVPRTIAFKGCSFHARRRTSAYQGVAGRASGAMHPFGACARRWCVIEGRPRIGRYEMSFIGSTGLDELARKLAEAVPESLRGMARDLEANFKAVLQAQLAKLDLVSRTEFDVQAALLKRTQTALAAMEQRLKDLEARIGGS